MARPSQIRRVLVTSAPMPLPTSSGGRAAMMSRLDHRLDALPWEQTRSSTFFLFFFFLLCTASSAALLTANSSLTHHRKQTTPSNLEQPLLLVILFDFLPCPTPRSPAPHKAGSHKVGLSRPPAPTCVSVVATLQVHGISVNTNVPNSQSSTYVQHPQFSSCKP